MPRTDLKRYLDGAFSIEQISAELHDSKSIFLLADMNGETAAYAKLDRQATSEGVIGRNPIKLKRLYCKKKFIGLGVGASLMKRCLDEAGSLNHDTIWLTVWKHNEIAQRFYRNWCFVECGTFEFQLGEKRFLDVLMQRRLSVLSEPQSTKSPGLSDTIKRVAAVTEHDGLRSSKLFESDC